MWTMLEARRCFRDGPLGKGNHSARNDRGPEGWWLRMQVWIDQDLCTGDGLCEEIAPAVFTLLDDGLAYVRRDGEVLSDPGGAESMAGVPSGLDDAVIEAAEECPGECIFIEAA